jgi:uncharacterized protein YukE
VTNRVGKGALKQEGHEMTRLGMDVDAVESIGHQMIAKAASLGSVGGAAGRLIQHGHSLWQGNTSRHWLEQWQRDEAAVRRLVHDLDAMGRKLLAQATEQRDASRGTSATAIGLAATGSAEVFGRTQGSTFSGDGRTEFNIAGNVHSVTELLATVDGYKPPAAFGALGTVLGVAGVSLGIYDGVEAANRGDAGAVGGAAVDVALGVTGVVAGASGAAVVIPLAIAKGFVDATIPYSDQAQDHLLDYQATRMFGADRTQLTPAQSAVLAHRYEGGWGWTSMLSDKMDQTYDETAAAIGGITSSMASGAGDLWNWMSGSGS